MRKEVTPMAYYRTCPLCGGNLDPGEKCDCQKEKNQPEEKEEAAAAMAIDWKPLDSGHKSKELQTA